MLVIKPGSYFLNNQYSKPSPQSCHSITGTFCFCFLKNSCFKPCQTSRTLAYTDCIFQCILKHFVLLEWSSNFPIISVSFICFETLDVFQGLFKFVVLSTITIEPHAHCRAHTEVKSSSAKEKGRASSCCKQGKTFWLLKWSLLSLWCFSDCSPLDVSLATSKDKE